MMNDVYMMVRGDVVQSQAAECNIKVWWRADRAASSSGRKRGPLCVVVKVLQVEGNGGYVEATMVGVVLFQQYVKSRRTGRTMR